MKYTHTLLSFATTAFFSALVVFPGAVYAQEAPASVVDAAPAVDVSADPQTDNNRTVSANEVAESLSAIPSIAEESSDVATTSDADSAIVATVAADGAEGEVAATTVEIPRNPEDGVTLSGGDAPAIEISLPNAAAASDAAVVADGTVAYPASNGSASAVQATEDGGVRMLTIIDNAGAPAEYPYTVTVPNGGHIELTEEGGAVVLDANGDVIATVDVPWAKDANGMVLQTWFTTDGQTLTQHVIHNVEGVVYPVNADPYWYAVVAGYVGWATAMCASSAIQDLGIAGVRAAVHNQDWYWNQRLQDAAWSCAGGVVFGPVVSRLIPPSLKGAMVRQLTNAIKGIVRLRA